MGLHPGMKFKYKKGKAKGKVGRVVRIDGNEILVKTSKGKFWCNRYNLENKIEFTRPSHIYPSGYLVDNEGNIVGEQGW